MELFPNYSLEFCEEKQINKLVIKTTKCLLQIKNLCLTLDFHKCLAITNAPYNFYSTCRKYTLQSVKLQQILYSSNWRNFGKYIKFKLWRAKNIN